VAGFWHCWLLVLDIVGRFLILLADQNVIANIRIRAICSMKAVGNCLSFTTKKPELIWTSRTQDISWKPNSVWAVGQVPTSPLLLRFELENGIIESWTLMKVLSLCLIFFFFLIKCKNIIDQKGAGVQQYKEKGTKSFDQIKGKTSLLDIK